MNGSFLSNIQNVFLASEFLSNENSLDIEKTTKIIKFLKNLNFQINASTFHVAILKLNKISSQQKFTNQEYNACIYAFLSDELKLFFDNLNVDFLDISSQNFINRLTAFIFQEYPNTFSLLKNFHNFEPSANCSNSLLQTFFEIESHINSIPNLSQEEKNQHVFHKLQDYLPPSVLVDFLKLKNYGSDFQVRYPSLDDMYKLILFHQPILQRGVGNKEVHKNIHDKAIQCEPVFKNSVHEQSSCLQELRLENFFQTSIDKYFHLIVILFFALCMSDWKPFIFVLSCTVVHFQKLNFLQIWSNERFFPFLLSLVFILALLLFSSFYPEPFLLTLTINLLFLLLLNKCNANSRNLGNIKKVKRKIKKSILKSKQKIEYDFFIDNKSVRGFVDPSFKCNLINEEIFENLQIKPIKEICKKGHYLHDKSNQLSLIKIVYILIKIPSVGERKVRFFIVKDKINIKLGREFLLKNYGDIVLTKEGPKLSFQKKVRKIKYIKNLNNFNLLPNETTKICFQAKNLSVHDEKLMPLFDSSSPLLLIHFTFSKEKALFILKIKNNSNFPIFYNKEMLKIKLIHYSLCTALKKKENKKNRNWLFHKTKGLKENERNLDGRKNCVPFKHKRKQRSPSKTSYILKKPALAFAYKENENSCVYKDLRKFFKPP